ncbi:MAG: MBL fold metallo-hydrolase [Candidatus Lokiarchaeota archaeon]|nr:MBL fold metallo-hydrolase [Candidatus Lokiarchaeota archaeon]
MQDHGISFEIQIVYDDICAKDGYVMDFGFSTLILDKITGDQILFDTGSNGKILLHNLKIANINPMEISTVIISHDHFDHAGGLFELSKKNHDFQIIVPETACNRYKEAFPNLQVQGVGNSMEIKPNMISSGQFGGAIKEQALFLRINSRKIVMLVGCTHPGLESFLLAARESNEVIAIFGGLHGFRKFSLLEGIKIIGACHCTQHRQMIKEKYPRSFKEVCVGSIFKF